MFTKRLTLTFLTLCSLTVCAQTNLVGNGGLETYTTCPNTLSQLGFATGWGQPTLHIGSPDYFNTCCTNTTASVPNNTFGSTAANQGQAYAGGYTYLNYGGSLATYREYVVGTLNSALVAGQSYIVSFQYARATNCRYASDAYGFYLSSTWPSNGTSGNGALPVTPTSLNPTGNFLSSNSWSTYADTIIASGGEQYITIGSFTQNATGTLVSTTGIQGAYMYVDDVKIIIYNGIFGDSNICVGDSASIYCILDTTHYWVDSANANVSLGTNDTLNVAPTQTTTYYAITYDDTFSFTVYVHDPPTEFVGNDTVLCEGDTLLRLVNLSGYSYLWSDNETDSALITIDSGFHWLEVSIYTCSRRDSFHVAYHEFPEFELVEDTTICHDDIYYLNTGLNTPLLFNWNTGGSTPGISVIDSGTYAVTVTNEHCSFSDTSVFHYYPITALELGDDKDFCYTSNAFIVPQVTNANTFNWSNSATTDSIQVNSSGMYFLTVSNNGLCEVVDSVEYNFYFDPTVSFSDDTARFCEGDEIALIPEVGSALPVDYLWSNTDNSPSILTNQIGLFWVEVSNEHCVRRDTIIVEMHGVIGVTLGLDQTLCEGEKVKLEPSSNLPLTSYQWSTGETSNTIEVSTHGTYSISVSNGVCTDADEINVFVLEYPEFDLGSDTLICPGDEITFDITQDAEIMEYNWSNRESQPVQSFVIDGETTVWATVSNGDCRTTDTILIDLHKTPSANLGNDTLICSGDQIALEVTDDERIKDVAWNTGQVGTRILVADSGVYEARVYDGNCTTKDKIQIGFKPIPNAENFTLDVPSEICLNESFELEMANPLFHAYLWQDGSTASSYTINSEGLYWVKGYHACGFLSDTALISRCECPIWVPSAFNPDGNTVNDGFAPKLDCTPLEYLFTVYDRWGEVVFESNNTNDVWDGKYGAVEAPMGAYAWKVVFTVYNEGKVDKAEQTGSVLLLR